LPASGPPFTVLPVEVFIGRGLLAHGGLPAFEIAVIVKRDCRRRRWFIAERRGPLTVEAANSIWRMAQILNDLSQALA
jgi:hypothetical protein